MATIGELGEFGLIEKLVARLGEPRPDTVIGAGPDDTAVLRLPNRRLQLATIDTQVEGVHFRRGGASAHDVGRKLAAVNLSDIAAMGGSPTHALATLSAPADLDAEWALDLVSGVAEELSRWGADLVGGNIARHEGLVIDLALLGEVEPDHLLLRSGARPGDVVMVTGGLGGAAAGLALLDAPTAGTVSSVVEAAHRGEVRSRLRTPEPRLAVGAIIRNMGATACLDISDGLASDVGHLCNQSGIGVRIRAASLPISAATRAVAAALGSDAVTWAVSGGEDYELLFTVRADCADELAATVWRDTGVPVTAIGWANEGPERVLVQPDDSEGPLAGGWRHFG